MKRIVLLFSLATVPVAMLGQTAPVPPLLQSARTVFVSNAGSDSGLFPHPFSGDDARPYAEFYAGLQGMGGFQLVDSPGNAELVYQIQLIAPTGSLSNNKQVGVADPLPTLKVTIYDRPSHVVLWAFAEAIAPAVKQKTHDENFEDAMHRLLDDVRGIVQPESPPVKRGAKAPNPPATP